MNQVKINILLFASLVTGFASCLKKDSMNIDSDSGTANVVEFSNTGDNAASTSSFYPRFVTDMGVVALGGSYKLPLHVAYSGAGNIAPEDITVTIALDTAALTRYNTEDDMEFETPPASIIKYPTSVTIKKGTHMAEEEMTVTVNGDYDFSISYALPLKITQASYGTISANFGTAMYSFTARNKYDGIYKMEAVSPMVDATNAALVGWYPNEVEFRTYNDKSIAMWDPVVAKNYGHCIKNGSSSSYYGSFSPVFFFDANGNITSTTNQYGQLSGGSVRSCVMNTGDNKITFNTDGSVKSFVANYIMTQGTAFAPRTYFYEKFTYLRAR